MGCQDGWGTNEDLEFISADVTIRAWQLTSSDLVFTSELSFTKGGTLQGTIPFGTTIDLDHHLVVVEVRDATVARGRVFYGGGSANLGNSGDPYGGVLFAYSQSETLLWTPSASSSAGFLIYVGGLWGDGTDKIESNNVLIKTTVITAGYTECPIPPDIPNASKLYNGTLAGSRTMYACPPGFTNNGGSPELVCDGLAWSTTSYSCSVSSTSTVPVTTSGATTNATTATLSTTPQTTIDPVSGTPVKTNNISLEEFNAIVEGLKVPKSNTSSHKRSLTCAYDPRPSSTAIGGVGIAVLCFMFVLLFIMDCTTITKENLNN
uniref:Uncharacterized protein LOC111114076 n=1 Tax=Crassostrea virginica TaxID=6565 RepID=A0A8B8BXG1_CRAVI|nr:uncharacterized protein LOC111114076 [Crassostrea virginica]